MKKRPPHVSYYYDRHGVMRWRYRKPGMPQSQTRVLFGSDEWLAWYHAASTGQPIQIGASRTSPGTTNALIVAYYSSAEWKLLAPITQLNYRGILERFRAKHGDKPFAQLEGHHIRKMMDAMADTPAAANRLLRMLRIVSRFGVERNWRRDDPTLSVRPIRYKTEGFHTWTEEEIAQFEACWALGTRERLALDLLLYTGQRSGDVRLMGRQHINDGYIKVKQAKTKATLDIPIAPPLTASLAAYQTNHLIFLATQHDQPYTAKGFYNWFAGAIYKAGLPVGVSPHGLRKAAARRLAEAGCTAHEIMAITGHTSLKEVARYTEAADQKTRADTAMAKAGKTDQERKVANLNSELVKNGAIN